MKMTTTTTLTLLAFSLVAVQLGYCQNYDEWIKTVDNIGQEIIINCTEYCDNAEANGCHPRDPIPDGFDEIKSWMGPAPSLPVWEVGTTNISASQCPTCEILGGGFQFRIEHFDPVHIGVYHCMLYNRNTSTYYLVKWGVNMRGPYFEDLLEKYEQNIIIGVSAFGAFLFVAITILLVYRYRWVPDKDEKHSGLATSQNDYGTNFKTDSYGFSDNKVEPVVLQGGKVNEAFVAESPPQYNGVKAEVQVHNADDQPGTSSSSSSESGSVRKRDGPRPPTPHHTATQGFDFDEETRF